MQLDNKSTYLVDLRQFSVVCKWLWKGLVVLFSFNTGVTSWHYGSGFVHDVKTPPDFGKIVDTAFNEKGFFSFFDRAINGTAPHSIALHCQLLHSTALRRIALHCIALHRAARTSRKRTTWHGTTWYSHVLIHSFSSFLLCFRFILSSQPARPVLPCQQQQCTTINGVLA